MSRRGPRRLNQPSKNDKLRSEIARRDRIIFAMLEEACGEIDITEDVLAQLARGEGSYSGYQIARTKEGMRITGVEKGAPVEEEA